MPIRAEIEGKAVTRAEAKEAILREFRAFPESKRESTAERLLFATEMVQKYKFQSSDDPYEVIKGWLISELPDENW